MRKTKLMTYRQATETIFSQSRGARIETLFCYVSPLVTDEVFSRLIGDVWTDTESPSRNKDLWHGMLTDSPRVLRPYIMTATERRYLAKLPDQLTLWRGYAGRRKSGLSWTLDREKAIWFAKRFPLGGVSMLVEGTCNKSDAAAYFDRREEFEIVINPKKVKMKTPVTV